MKSPETATPHRGRTPVILEAPSILGLDGTGVNQLGDALRQAGLATRLGATVIGRVDAPPQNPTRHPDHGMLNSDTLATYTVALANAVGGPLSRGEFPIVLGGDCTILLGNLLALRRRGRFGLLFVDGHADFYQPEANINGEAASSELALATGRGPEVMTRFEGVDRLISDEDVVVFGFRDSAEQREYGSQSLPPHMRAFDLAAIRRQGIDRALDLAVSHLTRRDLKGFWIHFDADVLADSLMPAVKYRLPDGFTWDDMVTVLRAAVVSGHAVGLDVTIYDPTLDPERHLARALVDTIARGFFMDTS